MDDNGKSKRIRNLLPPIRPGESRNPTGKNGRDKNKIIVDFLEACDAKDHGKRARILVLLEAMYLRARLGNGAAMKFLGEQFFGKAKQQIELTGENGGPIATKEELPPPSEMAKALARAMRIVEEVKASESAPREPMGIDVSAHPAIDQAATAQTPNPPSGAPPSPAMPAQRNPSSGQEVGPPAPASVTLTPRSP